MSHDAIFTESYSGRPVAFQGFDMDVGSALFIRVQDDLVDEPNQCIIRFGDGLTCDNVRNCFAVTGV